MAYIPNNDIGAGRTTLHRREKHRNIWRTCVWVLYTSVFFLLIFGVMYGVLYGSWFKIRAVEIQGITALSHRRFLAAIEENIIHHNTLLSLLGPDNTLFWKWGRVDSIAHPRVNSEKISVSVDMEERNVRIHVEERELYGVWCLVNRECYGFDRSGVVFTPTPNVQGTLMLRVDDENPRILALGYLPLPHKEWFEVFSQGVQILKENDIPMDVVKIKDFSKREWEVHTIRGEVFLFSFEFVPEELSEILQQINNGDRFRDGKIFDFRVLHRIYFR